MKENRQKHAGGRPKAENPLSADVKVRLTAADAQRLDRYCTKHSTNRAHAIRGAVVQMLDADDATK